MREKSKLFESCLFDYVQQRKNNDFTKFKDVKYIFEVSMKRSVEKQKTFFRNRYSMKITNEGRRIQQGGGVSKRSVNENHSETSTIKLGFANPKKGFSQNVFSYLQ